MRICSLPSTNGINCAVKVNFTSVVTFTLSSITISFVAIKCYDSPLTLYVSKPIKDLYGINVLRILLETTRLILRSPEIADLDHFVILRSDPDVMKYLGDGKVQTKKEVARFLKTTIAYQKKYPYSFFCVFEKDTGDFVGQASLSHFAFNDKQSDNEIAYRLHKRFWRKGYGTEIAQALVDCGFKYLTVKRLVAFVDPENIASRRVIEKIGMTDTGTILYYGRERPCYEIYRNNALA
jgi:RimJ/RimL family protein N-acetyltransferase